MLDYAGGHKYEIAYAFEKGEIGLRALEHSGIPTKYFLAPISELMNVHQDHPELSFGCSYRFDKFRTLTGELHIVGVSPNNDDHIFKLINKSKIEKVVFYYYAENEKNKKIPVHQEIEFKNVHELWKNLKALPKQHNSSYSIPILR